MDDITMVSTSVHDSLGMHVVKCRAELHEVLPDGLLWNEALLLAKVSDHAGKVTCISQLQHNVEFIVFYERGQVLDDVGMVEFLVKDRDAILNQCEKLIYNCADRCCHPFQKDSDYHARNNGH